ncbi:MAG: 3-(3-hydroxy-phenyl)propionate hydroxylase, partial [uncultured Rubrobacteraceae bacterium]
MSSFDTAAGAIRGEEPVGSDPEVLIAGGGPTGLLAANLLGQSGIKVLVVERRPGAVEEPRAVSLDDEAMRSLQGAGLLELASRGVVLPGTGTKYFGAKGQLLAYARGPATPPFGHPVKNPIDQPEFERMLLGGLRRYPGVRVEFSATILDFEQDAEGVSARVRSSDGSTSRVRARYLLGCDGGRSTVRHALGIRMTGTTFAEPWIVVDCVDDPHDERFAMHHGDPRRPSVVVPGRGGRCRYEFMLLPGEDPETASSLPFVRRLLAPHRGEVGPEQIVRSAVYTFHALVTERWRAGRTFLLGDAAHMMPPFAGQGLNSGMRDATNLTWKMAAVLRGAAGDRLLDTYELERRLHAEAIIRLSTRLGGIMMTTNRAKARLRDASIRTGAALPAVRRFLTEMRYKPAPTYKDGLLVEGSAGGDLAGRMLPQPRVLLADGGQAPLDDVLGPSFSLLAVD